MSDPVKHIFYIHSHITYAVSLGVLDHLNIEKKDVAFIYPKRYYSEKLEEYNNISIPAEFESYCENYKNPIHTINQIKKLYIWLEQNKIYKFHIYIPQKQIPTVKLLISQKYCEGYSFIEEGLAAYNRELFRPQSHDFKSKIKSILYPWNRIGNGYLFDDRYSRIYCTKETAFWDLPRKTVISPRFDCLPRADIDIPENSHIFALSPLAPLNKYLASAYVATLIEELNKVNNQRIFYKLHPDQYRNEEETLFEEIFSKFNSVKLSESFCIEALCNSDKEINLHLFASSIAIYADNNKTKISPTLNRLKILSPHSTSKLTKIIPMELLKIFP